MKHSETSILPKEIHLIAGLHAFRIVTSEEISSLHQKSTVIYQEFQKQRWQELCNYLRILRKEWLLERELK